MNNYSLQTLSLLACCTEVDVKSPEQQDMISDNAPPSCLNDGLITRRDYV